METDHLFEPLNLAEPTVSFTLGLLNCMIQITTFCLRPLGLIFYLMGVGELIAYRQKPLHQSECERTPF